VQEYPGSHDALLNFAEEERRKNARPELSGQIENPEDYDVIFLGYPNWYADLPMPLYTFLEQYDFSGKIIIPFCPHGGSRFSDTIKTIASLQPNATVINDGYTVSRERVPDAEDDVIEWVHSLDLGE
jgi:flavodoxin